ncbi:hypothetical protein A3C86_03965 [Candidatus Kaiserbacteria bacterium RIFCSPHIGHO2_02_FULL_49_16]|uniref:Uncharacterized protein n=1 Tax=Candidatus Kaiserbacteria bacterium RIFCSPHIGHO2_02_FULL_49_16 TaxID=1798490 RepID=A0A1F6DCG6_9BACT|nr:MAG: hypothetical protein A3C86_03965 [Candidatus Kaiserbacteria bacterium RIFCSPHIGHO2_02_FULL_49_16]
MSVEKPRIIKQKDGLGIIKHKDGRENVFRINEKDDPQFGGNLSNSGRSQISEVRLDFEGGRLPHKRDLVLKRYIDNADGPLMYINPIVARNISIVLYNNLKSIGVKNIPATFRPVGTKEILMTNYNIGGNIALSVNPLENPRKERIESLTNFNDAIKEIGEDLLTAALHHIYITSEAFFLVVPREGAKINCKLVIVDLEEVAYFSGRDFTPHQLVDANIVELIYRGSVESLRDFFSRTIVSQGVFINDSISSQLGDRASKILLPANLKDDIKRRIKTA